MSWLDDLLKQTKENEAPERYFWWSGLAAISAVVRKNVWIDRFYYNLYPNIYVALISEESGGKKGIPVSICGRILRHTKLARIISGNNSVQGILETLSTPETVGINVIKEAQAIMLSGELDSFLTEDPKSLSYLTDLYNTHEYEESWDKKLKSSQIKLKAPCLTMLYAANETMLGKVFTRKEIEGGFLGRSFYVYVKDGESGKKRNSLTKPPKFKPDIPKLSERLKEIAAISGEFKWTPEPERVYNEWYYGPYGEKVSDRTGTHNRLGDHVLKVAMLLSLSKKDRLEFDCEDIQTAIESCEKCAKDVMDMTQDSESPNGDRPSAKKLVLKCILAADVKGKNISEAAILSTLQPYNLTVPQVEMAVNYLIGSGLIEKNTISGNSNIYSRIVYNLTEEGKKKLKL